MQPSTYIHVFRTGFGRLARRHDATRRRAEEPSLEVNGRKPSVSHTRGYGRRVRRLRERERKRDRINKVAHQLTKEPAILVTENVGERPHGDMIEDKGAPG